MRSPVKTTYDEAADALYIRLIEGQPIARTEQLDPGTLVDVDRDGEAVGIEILNPARAWPLEKIQERFSIGAEDTRQLRVVGPHLP